MALGRSPSQIVASGNYPLLTIAEHWKRIPLCDVASVQNGAAFSSKYFHHETGMPLIRIRDVSRDWTENLYSGEYDSEYVVRRGDLLIGMDGDFSMAIWKGPDGLLNQRVCRIVLHSELYSPRFLYLVLQPYLNAIHAETSAVTVKHLSSRTIAEIPLPLPPLNEQHRIVEKIETLFSEIDAGVESFRQARAQIGVYRQALLKKAFTGELTADWRTSHPDQIEPGSSKEVSVLDILTEKPRNGKSVKSREGGFKVLRLTALKGGAIDLKESKEGDWGREDAEAYLVRKGDFLISRGNGSIRLVGRGGLVRKDADIAFPDTMIRLPLDQDEVDAAYFSLLWNSDQIRRQIESSARTTAGIYKINQSLMGKYRVPLCSLPEQKEIVRLLEAQFEAIEQNEREIDAALERAEALRQSILKKAFSGQLVEQDPDDEPASVLLQRICSEREVAATKTAPKKATNKR